MKKRNRFLIVLILVLILLLGIIIPKYIYTSHNEVPEGVWYAIIALVDNPIEKVIILGYDSVIEDSKEHTYHIKVKTIFGLTYADIYVTSNGSYIERRLSFLN